LLEGERELFRIGESSLFMVNSREMGYINSRAKTIEAFVKNRMARLQTYKSGGLLYRLNEY
jgi:hypothetical protein